MEWHVIEERIKNISYSNREERQEFVSYVFEELLLDSVLDVGCFRKHLRNQVSGKYVGVDLYGDPNLIVDLEEGVLPFPDASFTTVVCTDVLEHLENIHQIFDECLRVSDTWLIISLPNCYGAFWRPLITGHFLDAKKYYGLPVTKPIDRHRWYFNSSEAVRFIHQRSARNGAEVAFLWYLNTVSWRTKALLLPFLWSVEHRRNLITTSIWAVISTEES